MRVTIELAKDVEMHYLNVPDFDLDSWFNTVYREKLFKSKDLPLCPICNTMYASKGVKLNERIMVCKDCYMTRTEDCQKFTKRGEQ